MSQPCNDKKGCGKFFSKVYVLAIGRNLCKECFKKEFGNIPENNKK